MNDGPLRVIEREVKGWPGVTTGDTGRGEVWFRYARVELGYLRGSSDIGSLRNGMEMDL